MAIRIRFAEPAVLNAQVHALRDTSQRQQPATTRCNNRTCGSGAVTGTKTTTFPPRRRTEHARCQWASPGSASTVGVAGAAPPRARVRPPVAGTPRRSATAPSASAPQGQSPSSFALSPPSPRSRPQKPWPRWSAAARRNTRSRLVAWLHRVGMDTHRLPDDFLWSTSS